MKIFSRGRNSKKNLKILTLFFQKLMSYLGAKPKKNVKVGDIFSIFTEFHENYEI